MIMVCDRCAPDLNVATRPLLDDTIKCTFQVVLGNYLPIDPLPPPHFCAIVAVVEVDGTSQTLVTMAFHEFQDSEANSDHFRAKPYVQRRCFGVGIMPAYHLGGLLVVEVIEIVEVPISQSICAKFLPSALSPEMVFPPSVLLDPKL